MEADFSVQTNNLQADMEIAEAPQFDCQFSVFASGTIWGSISGLLSDQTDLYEALTSLSERITLNSEAIETKQDILTAGSNIQIVDGVISATDTTYTAGSGISIENGVISNTHPLLEWGNITGTLSNQSDLQLALNNKQDTISDLSTIRSNASKGLSAYNTISGYGNIVTYDASDFATSQQGALADTSLQPNDNISELVNDVGYITGISSTDVTDALGFTPYDATNPNGFISGITSSDVTTALGYTPYDNSNPDGFISGITSTDVTTALGYTPYDSTNPAGYITSASLNGYVPETREINGHALSSDITLTYSDVNALSSSTTIDDLTTQAQQDALNSGATSSNIGQITTNANNISDILDVIPSSATSSNKLTDKNYVDNSISTNTAYFDGSWATYSDVPSTVAGFTSEGLPEPSNNNYLIVLEDETQDGGTWRYKYVDNGGAYDKANWNVEYEVNETPFTQSQLDAINSGITSADVTLIGTALQPGSDISELNNDAGYITSASLPTVNNGVLTIQKNGTTINTFSANSSSNVTVNISVPTDTLDITNGAGYITSSALSGYVLSSQLSAVATSGLYSDLTGTPTIPTATSDLVNDSGFITSSALSNYVTLDTAQDITGTKTFIGQKKIYFKQSSASDKLGFTLYNSSNSELGALEYRPNTINGGALLNLNVPVANNGYVGFRYWGTPAVNIVAPRVTTAGDYFIPVNVTDGNSTVTANSSGTLDISSLLPTVPTNISAFTNDSGYITSSALSGYATETWVGNQGYITGITSSDVTTALGYTPYNSSNPAGYITSSALSNYVTNTDLSTTLASYVLSSSLSTVATSGSYDDLSDKPTIPTVDQTYDGTSANAQSGVAIIDLLETLYPIGSIYIGTMSTCPLATLGVGTWQLVSSGKVLQGADSNNTAGSSVSASLPQLTSSSEGDHSHNRGTMDITGGFYARHARNNTSGDGIGTVSNGTNAFSTSPYSTPSAAGSSLSYNSTSSKSDVVTFTASNGWSGSTNTTGAHTHTVEWTGNVGTTVQPPAYIVNIWERTA